MDLIRKHKNIVYLTYSFDLTADQPGPIAVIGVNSATIAFPPLPHNVKANHALISVDKLFLTADDIENAGNYPLVLTTTIPSSNNISGMLEDFGVQDPRNIPFEETIVCTPYYVPPNVQNPSNAITLGAVYQNNNPDHKVLCVNPFGNQYTFTLNSVDFQGRTRNGQNNEHITFVLRVELLEEEIKRN